MDKQETRGGQRPNSGRKPSGIKWKTVSFRIVEEWRQSVKEVVRAEIKRLKNDCTPK